MIYLIAYDLIQPGRDYSSLYERIKAIGNWSHYLSSVWLVNPTTTSYQNVTEIVNYLRPMIDANDRLLVLKIDKITDLPNGYLPQSAWDWINAHS